MWRWGSAWPNLSGWQGLGFSGSLLGAFRDPPDARQVARVRAALDAAGAAGHAMGLYLHPLLSQHLGAAGSADPADPTVRAHALDTMNAWMHAVGGHPALSHLLLNSEVARQWQGPAADLTALMAIAAKRVRPDLLTWTDPWRDAPLRVPPGIDCLGSWSYGHPHPLRQWLVPFLRAGAGPGRKVMQTVSLYLPARWTASGEERGAWRVLPPDPAAIALWLAFAQAPDIISVYAPSTVDPFAVPVQDPQKFSPETWPALARVHETAIAPIGPVLSACRPAPARIGLLLSAEAVGRVPAAARAPGWDSELAWPVAAMLVMQGFPFQVLLDEDMPPPERLAALVVPLGTAPERLRGLAGPRVVAPAFDVAFLRAVDGAVRNRITAEEATRRLSRLAEALAAMLPAGARMARHDPELAVASHVGGAATWHVAVNLALAGPPGATFRDQGVARQTTLALRSPPGTRFYDALAGRPLAAREAEGFANLLLDLPRAGGAIIAALPAEPGPPTLAPVEGGAVLRAPFAAVLPYDVAIGGAVRRVATGADGTLAIAASGRVRATCALTGQRAELDR